MFLVLLKGIVRSVLSSLLCFNLRPRHENGDVLVTFDHPQKAIALGQVVAIWDKDWCLGSGRIKDTW
jgi:tRNA U34 2-thiouridine synthase MnmA/TrmU